MGSIVENGIDLILSSRFDTFCRYQKLKMRANVNNANVIFALSTFGARCLCVLFAISGGRHRVQICLVSRF